MSAIGKVRITVTVPETTYLRLKHLAETTERTVPGYIRHLLAVWLSRPDLPRDLAKPAEGQ